MSTLSGQNDHVTKLCHSSLFIILTVPRTINKKKRKLNRDACVVFTVRKLMMKKNKRLPNFDRLIRITKEISNIKTGS